jgi:formate/nitrite transporter FocA (FNT family)
MGIIFLVIDSFIRHVYNQFALITGRSLKTYSAFDRKFAVIDGRRNFYVIYFLVFSILGNPLSGLFLSIVHASITAIIYLARSIQHLSMLDREK